MKSYCVSRHTVNRITRVLMVTLCRAWLYFAHFLKRRGTEYRREIIYELIFIQEQGHMGVKNVRNSYICDSYRRQINLFCIFFIYLRFINYLIFILVSNPNFPQFSGIYCSEIFIEILGSYSSPQHCSKIFKQKMENPAI